MSAADTGVHPILGPAPARPRPRVDRRAQVVREVLEIIGSTRWGSPPPDVSVRQVLLRVLLTTIAFALLLWGST